MPPLSSYNADNLHAQLSQIYKSIKVSRVASLVKFASTFEIEQFVVQAVKDRVFQARISHGQGAIFFGSNLLSSGAEDESEGPQLQTLQSQMMRRQLTTLSTRLSAALGMIDPQQQANERLVRRKAVFDGAANKIEKDHQALLHRPDEIQAREVSSYLFLYIASMLRVDSMSRW